MIAKLFGQAYNPFAALLSGTLLFLAFPKFDLWWLAWIGFLPLFIVLLRERAKTSFLWSYVCGIVFYAGIFNWVLDVPGYRLLHHAILVPYLGLYFGIFGWIFSNLNKQLNPAAALIISPFLWILLEFVRSNLSFLALPWALLAHSQYLNPSIIQIASFTGAYGVSFLVVSVNSALGLFLTKSAERIGRHHPAASNFRFMRPAMIAVLSAVTLSGTAFLYGRTEISRMSTTEKVKISVVQGNIDQQKKKYQRRFKKFIMQRYSDLSRDALMDSPALIVWPEAATPGLVIRDRQLLYQIRSLTQEANAYFLIGSSEYTKFSKKSGERRKRGNTAIFFSPKGKILGQYLKINLVPFGEHLPYKDIIPWPEFIAPDGKNWDHPGTEFTLFDISQKKFGVIICWEIVFPDLFRRFVKNGANFMLNITNEGWFGDTAAPYQMLAISVFRAVENRVSLTRSANTGISCFIDPLGRITGRVRNTGKDIFVEGYLTQDVQLSKEKTFYTLYGDIFVYICIVISSIGIITALLRGQSGSFK